MYVALEIELPNGIVFHLAFDVSHELNIRRLFEIGKNKTFYVAFMACCENIILVRLLRITSSRHCKKLTCMLTKGRYWEHLVFGRMYNLLGFPNFNQAVLADSD